MPKFKDLTGQRFGYLTIIKKAGKSKNNKTLWLCKCDCGNEKICIGNDLITGRTKSCGCLRKKGSQRTHGFRYTRLYYIWQGIKKRCLNKNTPNYYIYGGRGIAICDEWKNDFKVFHDWAFANGYDENAKRGDCTIERIDVNGNYEPSNCRWATMKEQCRNTRSNNLITYNNETRCLMDWSYILNINYDTLLNRFKKGWTIEKAFMNKDFRMSKNV